MILRDAVRVLIGNWDGGHTVPSAGSTPTSGAGTPPSSPSATPTCRPGGPGPSCCRCSGRSGRDGRVPHIVFNPAVPDGAYFPGPEFWHRRRPAPVRRGHLRHRAAARARAGRAGASTRPSPTWPSCAGSIPGWWPSRSYLRTGRRSPARADLDRAPLGVGHGQQPRLGPRRSPPSSTDAQPATAAGT